MSLPPSSLIGRSIPGWFAIALCLIAGLLGVAPARADGEAVPLAPLSQTVVQGPQDEAGMLATARALLARPATQADAFDPAVRHAGGERVLWVRIALPVLAADHVWHLRLPQERLDRVTLYRLGADGGLLVERAGELVPASAWAQRTRMPSFRLGVNAGSPQVLVLAVQNRSPHWLDLAAVDDAAVLRDEQREMFLIAAYFGVIAFAVVYSLLRYAVTHDRLYGLYALYLFVMALRQDLRSGLSRSLWLPDATQTLVALRHLSLLAAFLFGLLLVRALLPPQLVGLRTHRAGTAAIVVALLLGFAYPALPPELAFQLYNVYGLVTLLLIALMLLRAWQPGLRQLNGFALGFAAIAVAALVPMLVNLAVLPPSDWSRHSLLLGSVVEALILAIALSIGLSDEIAVEMARQDRSPRDPATGFHGAGLLPPLVHALLLRHRRAGAQAAVIALDVSNAQDLLLHHGKEAHEAMVQVARRLVEEHARESDVALRLGRTRFALVLTRTSGPHQALAVAQRIIDQGLRQRPELPPSEHLRIHAVVALLPEHVTARGQGLLQALHAALDQIRPGSGLVLREIDPARP